MGFAGDHAAQFWRAIYLNTLLVFGVVLSSCISPASAQAPESTSTPEPETGPITVKIQNPDVNQAIVYVIGMSDMDDLDQDILSLSSCSNQQYISAWAPGYYVENIQCNGNSPFEYQVTLEPVKIEKSNSAAYGWTSITLDCIRCHIQAPEHPDHDEYNEWNNSAHAKIFRDRYFESMYSGINLQTGKTGEQTQWALSSDGKVRLQPSNSNSPDYTGPGFRLDYPNEYGNCAYCHVPAAVDVSKINVNLNGFFPQPGGATGEGVTCDICHKVIGVALDGDDLPYTDQPGVLSFEYLPSLRNGLQTFFGPIPYSTQNQATHQKGCLPIYNESSFCAACHYGRFHDMLIYGSYSEWKDSKYSVREVSPEGDKKKENPEYRSCQDCHMLSPEQIGETLRSQREACSINNKDFNNFNHNMLQINGKSLIKDAATLQVELEQGESKDSIKIIVKVTNTKAGHNFPTDSPLRHLILVVEARDEQKNLLPQTNDERIPVWGGVGVDPNITGMDNYGGMPGKIFANLLVDVDTNVSPTAAYWNPTKYLMENPAKGTNSDTRLKPGATDESNYTFTLPARGKAYITVKLVYRYAFIDLARQKGWYRPDFDAVLTECPPIDVTHPETWGCSPPTP